jgi:uncharacterized protein (TIGR02679 family)
MTASPQSAAQTDSPDANPTDAKLHRLLGGEPVAWLLQRARDRLESGRPLTGSVTLPAATPAQRQAVERLTGRPGRSGTSLSVSLTEVDRILRDSGAAPGGLTEAVTRLTGPVRDRSRERAQLALAWDAAYAVLDSATGDRAELAEWREWLDTTGIVRRLADSPGEAQVLLAGVASALGQLPSRGVPIGRLAAECCGDAHALDDGQPVGTLVLSAVRALAGLPFAAEGTADSRRAAWASAGVHLDDLSSLVLCVGLPGDTRTVVGRVLAANREAGQPTMLTLRQLRCHDEPLRAVRVWICENPVVVAAAADELGGRCQPLVCVAGQPSAAGWRLLDLLAAGGAEFGYHGDFDWGGARIAEAVRRRVNWQPWRYNQLGYTAAISATAQPPPRCRLRGDPVPTPWDPQLAAEMLRQRIRIEEELTLDALLDDLSLS